MRDVCGTCGRVERGTCGEDVERGDVWVSGERGSEEPRWDPGRSGRSGPGLTQTLRARPDSDAPGQACGWAGPRGRELPRRTACVTLPCRDAEGGCSQGGRDCCRKDGNDLHLMKEDLDCKGRGHGLQQINSWDVRRGGGASLRVALGIRWTWRAGPGLDRRGRRWGLGLGHIETLRRQATPSFLAISLSFPPPCPLRVSVLRF